MTASRSIFDPPQQHWHKTGTARVLDAAQKINLLLPCNDQALPNKMLEGWR